MGRASRRKRERKLDAGDQFRAAMQDVEAEDRRQSIEDLRRIAEHALGAGWEGCKAVIFVLRGLLEHRPQTCLGCGGSIAIGGQAITVAAWKPNAECLRRDFGMSPDYQRAAVLYSLCIRCAEECREDSRRNAALEKAILAELHAEGHIPEVAS